MEVKKIKTHSWQIKKLKKFSDGINYQISIHNFQVSNPHELFLPVDYFFMETIHPVFIDYKKKNIYFVELNTKITHNDSFFYKKLQEKAKHLLSIPILEFMKMVSDYNICKSCSIVFIHHSGRTGSTLLHKIFNANSMFMSSSEDLIFDNLFLGYNHNLCDNIFKENLFFDLIRYLHKKYYKRGITLVFKMTGFSFFYCKNIQNTMLDIKHLYLGRNHVEQIESFLNLFMNRYSFLYRIFWMMKLYKLRFIPITILKKYSWDFFENDSTLIKLLKAFPFINLIQIIYIFIANHKKIFQSIFKDKKNILFLNYNDICDANILQDRLNEYLDLKHRFVIDKKIYNTHSQSSAIWSKDKAKSKKIKLLKKDILRFLCMEDYLNGLIVKY
jgi:hypothetical protein